MANNFTTSKRLALPAAYRSPAARAPIALWGGLLLVILLPLFASLGLWQWGKWQDKMFRQATQFARSQGVPQTMPRQLMAASELRDRHFSLHGEYDAAHQILIDNRVYREQAGYHVITPLRLRNSPPDAPVYVLVNRGWVPAAAEHSLIPAVPPPSGPITISGIAVLPDERFFTLGPAPAAGWQTVWQNLDWLRFQRSVSYPLQPVLIQLDASAPGGYLRDWRHPDGRAEHHLGYALQWFGFAIASLGIWLHCLLRRP